MNKLDAHSASYPPGFGREESGIYYVILGEACCRHAVSFTYLHRFGFGGLSSAK